MMKSEIGSEFWAGCTPQSGTGVAQYLPTGMDIRYTLCGRTALELVLRDAMAQRKLRKAYLPSYCCHTMIEPFISKGIVVEYYDVFFTDIEIRCDFAEDNDCDLVFLMDYFGFCDENIPKLAKSQRMMGKCVVYDATHTLFCENADYSSCDYVFGSFRKWFNVNAGFCAKSGRWNAFPKLMPNVVYTTARNKAFADKQQFMAGTLTDKDAFLRSFALAEEKLETDYVGYGPDIESLKFLESVDAEFVRGKRCKNAVYVIDKISTISSEIVYSPYKQVREGNCPLFVPLRVEPELRTALRQLLVKNRVYLPIHWPLSHLHCTNDVSRQIYNAELSFICDQRYDFDDIDRAIQIIRSF